MVCPIKGITWRQGRCILVVDNIALFQHGKGLHHEVNETIHTNPHGTDHSRHHPWDCHFFQNPFADRRASFDAFHTLDHFLGDPHRDHHLVRDGI